ncbi:hypothetical protein L1049_002668 [Liquidambar formosana]|uniref:TCP domain-containing protein n=1 Tax=Liquidambar formosana TaxID=63359 RepID=A0AAP0NFF1_LIQFO
MITSSREADFPTKQEGSITEPGKIAKASSSSTPWLKLKDPRIVRVSRAFGGKDRHSKVRTVRGLRDRRVRLSVPTAIQLYDLQDRLGLNQPSKVVDWLLNAAKRDIDELPPLQMPSGNFGQNYHSVLAPHEVGVPQSNKEGLKINNGFNLEDPTGLPKSYFWNSEMMSTSKGVARETVNEKVNWMKRNVEEKQEGTEGHDGAQVSSNNFFSRANHSSLPAGLLANTMPYGSYYHWEPSNFTLSHLGSHGLTPQTDELHNFNVVPLPSTLSIPSGSQVLVCPPGTTQSYFPSHVAASVEFDPRQINHFQMLSSTSQNLLSNSLAPPLYSISQPVRPFHLSMAPKPLVHSQNNSESPLNKGTEFSSK